ncbi:helix-turn-helix domain-containing protein [Sphingobium sp. 3R8]|uniref:IclR family transcriptional regulator n=1 Tax=Sphingobium sp. 3R8 TaxID=2874921 RepID=UPI001CCBFC88|nr:helix-turn-helix domain-containing protein [Sphingobium sp. 3R8]MBZ9646895.1 helix-turn-helix domain-containing protein [Sphingobium sp. 3R8]
MSNLRLNKSAQRAMQVFELFSDRMQPLSVGEITLGLNIPQPSVSVLLRNLADMGYLHYDQNARKFVPTLRIMLLGSWIQNRLDTSGDMAKQLKLLQPTLGETLMIGVQNASRAQYILVNEADRPDRLLVASGLMRPLLRSAVGRILLSLKSDAEIAGWVRRCNAEEPDASRQIPLLAFMDIMHMTRQRGYGETAGDVTEGFGTIAFALSSPMDGSPMAVACGMPLERLADKKALCIATLQQFASLYPRDAQASQR